MSTDPDTQSRLDKQARAILRLRQDRDRLGERIDALVARVEFLETMVGGQVLASSAEGDRQPVSGDGSGAEPVSDRSDTGDPWDGEALRPVLPLVGQGTWTERTECLVCGGAKASGRQALTCSRCSARRTEAIRGSRPRLPVPECLNCGESKAPGGLIFLCPACRKGQRQAGHG